MKQKLNLSGNPRDLNASATWRQALPDGEEFKAIRKENETLRAENLQLKEQIGALREHESSRSKTWYSSERAQELRERVEKALSLLATLEGRQYRTTGSGTFLNPIRTKP